MARKYRLKRGKGFFGNIWKGLKSVYNIGKKVKPSRFIGLIPDNRAKIAAGLLDIVGLGRRGRPFKNKYNRMKYVRWFRKK